MKNPLKNLDFDEWYLIGLLIITILVLWLSGSCSSDSSSGRHCSHDDYYDDTPHGRVGTPGALGW